MWHLNGLMFVYAYLHYLLVHDRVLAGFPPDRVAETDDARTIKLVKVVDDMILDFRSDVGLNPTQRRRTLRIAGEIKRKVLATWPREDAEPNEWLAAIAAHLFCEEHINNGYIRMGRVFDPAMADRFLDRVEFCRGHCRVIAGYAAKLVAGEEFTHTEQNQIRYWQEYAVTYPEDVRKDFGDIRMYVGF